MEEKYINYYRLLLAILNSDDETVKGRGYQVIVYDKNDSLPIGVFQNSKRCANFFEVTASHICRSIRENFYIKKKYKVEIINEN